MNDYTKSVDELARKTHPRAMQARGAQGYTQLRAQARLIERRRIIAALAISVIAALCVGLAIYYITAASS